MYKVLIVDDHKSLCDSIENKLTSTGDFNIVGKITNALETELYCKNFSPDLIFMDICTEERASGLDAIKTILEKYPEIKIIAMSGFSEITYAQRAKEAGANAFVSKSKSLDYFEEVAYGVMKGESYHQEQKNLILSKGEVKLTPREMEVLRLLCMPMTTKEIAAELDIHESTVKLHKVNMLAKTGFVNTQDLIFYMINNGLINPLF